MFRLHALGGVSVAAFQLVLLAPAGVAHAQSGGEKVLPPVTIDAPRAPTRRAARKPGDQAAAVRRRVQRTAAAPERQRPVVVINTEGAGANASLEPPPIKQKYQLPQTSESITAKEIQEKINVVDTEDAVKYMPSLFVRKRNAGDTQPVLATRTTGVGASARSLVYADDILLSALIANNNTIGAPRWGLVAPEEIQRVDFLYGPFSAAYPGNSVGGVLQITTRMPEKLEITAKQTEALQSFDFYKTKNTYRTDQTSVSIGDRKENFSYFISGNFQNSFSQPLAWVTTGSNLPAGVTGAIPQSGRVPGTRADVIGAGGLLHTEMANVKGKFAWHITPWVKATYIVGYWSNDAKSNVQSYLTNAAGATVFGGSPTSVSGFAGNYYTLNQQHLANAVSLRSDTRGTFDFDLSASRYDYLQDIQRNPFNVIPNSAAFTPYGSIARMDGTNWMNGDAKGIWRPNDAHEVSFGFHADRYYLNNPTYQTPDWNGGPDSTNSLYTVGQGATRTLGLWVQDAWRFAPMFKLTAGGRLEDWKAYGGYNLATQKDPGTGNIVGLPKAQGQPELGAQRFSPKASLAFEPSRQWLLTASIGQAYRFPTVAELYQSTTVGTTPALPNPTLRPENVLSEEIAIERRFTDGKVRLSFFNENVHDALISQLSALGDGSGNVATFTTNVEAIRNTGVELAAQKNNVLIDGLETFGSVTYVDSRILRDPTFVSTIGGTTAEGKRVPNIPAWRVTAGATYRPNAWWSFTAAMRHSSKQYSTLDNTDTVRNVFQAFDPFTVVDLRAQYRFSETATANFGIDNVGNAKYTLFHPFPQRTYIADVRIKF